MATAAELAIIISGRDNGAADALEGVNKKAGGLGDTLGKVGTIAGGFLAANVIGGAASALTGFLGDSVQAASSLGESLNAVQKIFGESSSTILDWGENNATQFGLSQRAFNELATPLGAMLKNAGLDMEMVTGSTIDLTTRAADMASVFNVDVSEALGAIQAGLRGEADPLERFGVSLSAAKVEARALADSGKAVASTLTDQEKMTARLAILFEQTASSAGDFADTSDGLANSQRIAAARTEELQATIGTKLIPVTLLITQAKLKLVEVLADKVIPFLEVLYAKHWPAISAAIETAVAVVQENWTRLQPLFQFTAEFVIAKIGGMIQMIEGIITVVTNVVDLVDNLIHGRWAAAWENLKNIAMGIVDILIGQLHWMFGNLPDVIMDQLSQLPDRMGSLARRAAQSFLDNISIAGVSVGDITSFVGGAFAEGTTSVPRDMLAVVHKGEAIIPANQNPFTGRGGGGGLGGGLTVNINAPVYGVDELDRMIAASVRRAVRGGDLTDVLVPA